MMDEKLYKHVRNLATGSEGITTDRDETLLGVFYFISLDRRGVWVRAEDIEVIGSARWAVTVDREAWHECA